MNASNDPPWPSNRKTESPPDVLTPRLNPASSITSSLFNSPIDPLSAQNSPALLPQATGYESVTNSWADLDSQHRPGREGGLRGDGRGDSGWEEGDARGSPTGLDSTGAASPAATPSMKVVGLPQVGDTEKEGGDGPPERYPSPADRPVDRQQEQRQQEQQRWQRQRQEQGSRLDDRKQAEHVGTAFESTGPGEIVVISGGSGYNDLVLATPGATYVMPISDNGGSSSEIIRVLGGPSIGDLRSRLNRLIPIAARSHPSPFASATDYQPPASNGALHALLSYRLPSSPDIPSRTIKQEWQDILEGRHPLWNGIEPERKEVVRGFLVHFQAEVLRRAHRNFNFRGASIGNFFLAASQKFFRSIQSAIFLFSATTQINAVQCASKVLPVINTNHTATIAALTERGHVIVGQCEISHPAVSAAGGGARRQAGSRSAAAIPSMTPTRSLFSPAVADLASSGRVSTQEPGTPSSAIFDPISRARPAVTLSGAITRLTASSEARSSHRLSRSLVAIDLEDAGALHSEHGNRELGTSYDSLSGGLVFPTSSTPAPSAGLDGRDRDLDRDPRAQSRTTVGNFGDGLEPDDDDDDDDNDDDADQEGDEVKAGEIEDGSFGLAAGASGGRATQKPREAEKLGNIVFSKTDEAAEQDGEGDGTIGSRIERIFYVNAYRNEIYPAPNPSFLASLRGSRTLIYSCGSLWTSIIPCLSLRGVATHIATSSTLRYKVLLLNTVFDRETRGLDALDFLRAITSSLNRTDTPGREATWKTGDVITHLVYFEDGQIFVDVPRVQELGVVPVRLTPSAYMPNGRPKFCEDSIRTALDLITQSGPSRDEARQAG